MRSSTTAILLLLQLCLLAQSDTWRTEDGLSNDWVSDVIQDDEGYLWIATQYGLNRFDGYQFESINYTPNDPNSLSGNWVRHLAKNSKGKIILNCYLGDLHLFDPLTKQLSKIERDPNRQINSISRIVLDSKDNLWVGGPSGLLKLSTGDDRLAFVSDHRVRDIDVLKNGNLLVLSDEKILQVSPQLKIEILSENRIDLKELFVDHEGQVWGMNVDQVFIFNSQDWSASNIEIEDFNRPRTFVGTSIYEDKKNRIWIAGEEGVTIIDSNRKKKEYVSFGALGIDDVDDLNILKIYEDKDENIWLGTDHGLTMISKMHTRFDVPEIQNVLRGISGVRDVMMEGSNIYLGAESGLYLRNIDDVNYTNQPFFDEAVYAIHKSQNGDIYLGGPKGIFRKRNNESKFVEITNSNYLGGVTWDIAEDEEGYVWIASLGGLSRFDPKSGNIIKLNNETNEQLESAIALCIDVDDDGNLWGGSLKDGIYKLTNLYDFPDAASANFINYRYDDRDSNSLTNNIIQSMIIGADGAIWVGTDGGLNHIQKNGTNTKYLKGQELKDDKFMSLHIDQNNVLWGSTIGHGVMAMNLDDGTIAYYDKEDGLKSNNYLLNSAFLTQGGLLFLGSDQETQVIDTEKALKFDPISTNLVFSKLDFSASNNDESENRAIKNGEEVDIPFDQAFFNISFSTIQFYKPNKTEYSYRILPIQEVWQSNGSSRKINFNGLQEGAYTLEVKAANPLLSVSPEVIRLQLNILPPWWRSKLAYLCYVLLGCGLIYLLYRRQQEIAESRRLKEMNDLKAKLYTNITHEIRTPLTVILGLSKKLMYDGRKAVASSSGIINRNGNHLLLLVNRILDLSKIESGKMQVNMAQKDIVSYVSYLLESFRSWAEDKDIRTHFLSSEEKIVMDFDQEIIKQIINNLMSNAIKYSPLGGDIYCHVSRQNNQLRLSIEDTGSGIDETKISYLFERFYQEEAAQNSSGIGLAVTKELVQLIDGTISVKNNPKKGCTFTVVIPIRNQATKIDSAKVQHNDVTPFNEALDKILIIEDNVDVLNFIEGCLRGQYEIVKAINGKDGIEKAVDIIPDIIISDVMMPLMDGYEVCQRLKSDPRTNHIPIVLLTAKADDESKLAGLEHGADEYLIKPFDAKELELRIYNLLTMRKNLREQFQGSLLDNDEDLSHQDPFVTELIKLIDNNLSDSKYGIPQICRSLGISRVHLHRKLKALTNHSTSLFIRKIRLARGHKMLQQTDKNVSEVAYDVGFNDPAYFSKVYTERYNQSPSKTKGV